MRPPAPTGPKQRRTTTKWSVRVGCRPPVDVSALVLCASRCLHWFVAVQSKVQSIVLQSVLMAFDLVLMAAVIPIIQKVESGKDRILKVCEWHCVVA
jgi:hypothetical protein